MKKKTVLIVGGGVPLEASLAIQKLKEEYGAETTYLSAAQAKEQGLEADNLIDIPELTIAKTNKDCFLSDVSPKSGRERRIERRKRKN